MKVVVRTALAVTSFFQYYKTDEGPGARGGGFIPYSRMETEVALGKGRVKINGVEVEGRTTRMALKLFGAGGKVDVAHTSPFPVGSGFGTSGSGSWGAVIGASFILGKEKDYFELAGYAHDAEIKMKTGLGTVASISMMPTGAGLLVEPGRPGRALIKPILFEEDRYRLIFVIFGRKDTTGLLSSPKALKRLSKAGERAMDIALGDVSLEGLFRASRYFAEECGIVGVELLNFCRRAEELGASGAFPNMIGEAVHIVAEKDKASELVKALRKEVDANVLIDRFGHGGADVTLINDL